MQSPTRKKILEIFTNKQNEFVSGEELAKLLGCSRTAVWKHIEELRKEGFQLEAIRKKGYRIIDTKDRVSENEIQLGLKTKKLGCTIYYVESIDSTQKLAHSLVQDGCPEGTIVVAEEQLNGRGRLARTWFSPKYSGIWMSVILRPTLPPKMSPQFTLIAAIAVVQAIAENTTLHPEIKWPNDILINGKKVSGILTELQADSDKVHAIIIGIGINVNQKQFPDELKQIATSLFIESGKETKRSHLIQAILEKIETYYQIYMEKGFAPLKLLWENYAVSIGKDIIAHTLNGDIIGKAIGITDEGVLKLEDQDEKVHLIYSADIEIQS